MKAIRLFKPGEPLRVQHLDLPAVGPRDVLVRVKATGICHSDAHYRAGTSPVHPLPLTLGHEVAGTVEAVGSEISHLALGDRVCVHYLATCGICHYCHQGQEQFCTSAAMMGKHRDGGFAEFVIMPARSVFPLPAEIPFEHGAILMCSSATSLHALHKARLKPGETVAVFGAGGLGLSAIQLAKAFGASQTFAIDLKSSSLAAAAGFGAIPINAALSDCVDKIRGLTQGRGVDVALELVGLPSTMRQAVASLAVFGRAALVGITPETFPVSPYTEIINKEAEIIGVSDHLARELPSLLYWAKTRALDLSTLITRTVPLDPDPINEALDHLERFAIDGRIVVVNGGTA